MFPRSSAVVAIVVGGIWTVQGFGILPTGSFMDGQNGWGAGGLILLVAGLAALVVRKRRERGERDQPGS